MIEQTKFTHLYPIFSILFTHPVSQNSRRGTVRLGHGLLQQFEATLAGLNLIRWIQWSTICPPNVWKKRWKVQEKAAKKRKANQIQGATIACWSWIDLDSKPSFMICDHISWSPNQFGQYWFHIMDAEEQAPVNLCCLDLQHVRTQEHQQKPCMWGTQKWSGEVGKLDKKALTPSYS